MICSVVSWRTCHLYTMNFKAVIFYKIIKFMYFLRSLSGFLICRWCMICIYILCMYYIQRQNANKWTKVTISFKREISTKPKLTKRANKYGKPVSNNNKSQRISVYDYCVRCNDCEIPKRSNSSNQSTKTVLIGKMKEILM